MTNECHLRINVHKIVKSGGKRQAGWQGTSPMSKPGVKPTHSTATAKEGHPVTSLPLRELLGLCQMLPGPHEFCLCPPVSALLNKTKP